MPLLEMKHITKAFSGVYANEDVSLSVEKGEIHALLGENGAGKTTLMNILFGIYQSDGGEILYKGEAVQFKSPADAISQGIGMVHQHFSLVNRMTVLDNIILGSGGKREVLDRKRASEEICLLVEKYGLYVKPDEQVGSLSVGEQQRVEILKALYRKADLLILDEPTGVLTPQETENFFHVLRRLKDEGHGIIIITHRLSEIMAISDRVTILRDGKSVNNLVTSDTTPEELSAFMIGRPLSAKTEERKKTSKEAALSLEGISLSKKRGSKKALDNICLTVYKGEILGIAGVEGNGQKELAEVITGICKHTGGSIAFDGEAIDSRSVRDRFHKGISYISDDRHKDSLVVDMTVTENMILRTYNRAPFSKRWILDYKKAENRALEAVAEYGIRTSGKSGTRTPVKLMSGGNQQKVILSREISQEARLIVASQPTRGLDIGATEFVHQTLIKQKNQGKSVLLISADLDEILSLSDRIAVMFEGRIMGILDRKEADVFKIGLYMGGVTDKGGTP
ncbi:ABC transporter ATP-binding protein [Lacrimispora sp.]|uniref:ABC transporter ATP-binding protein n=1 Tax=Lacrimispora sp. TaxID=2719234 RepID=UPI0028A06BD6|nr:ABC transporter ATP-binding protein [Lacrimispora sp.]